MNKTMSHGRVLKTGSAGGETPPQHKIGRNSVSGHHGTLDWVLGQERGVCGGKSPEESRTTKGVVQVAVRGRRRLLGCDKGARVAKVLTSGKLGEGQTGTLWVIFAILLKIYNYSKIKRFS